MIRRLLVANRGEIARRVFRTCRAMGVETVAVFSDPDRGAPFAREADVAVAIGGAAPAESYLRGEALVAAARKAGADAIHPGYGFLAENAEFAQAVLDAGLVWVGPSPEAIAAMGSKIEAKRRMEAAGVPVVPSGAAADVGLPLMVKASAGGGGKGMRIVRDPAKLEGAVEAARREAEAAFGDGTVFLERYVEEPRHVEIQIAGDRHGRVVSLHERECSIQRRHQKVIEESPSPAVDPELRARMGEAAVAAGEALGYEGAGTVEFLLAPGGEFFFLEMNTRLQVEHPVTELVTGLDLVRLQLVVADGGAVPDPPPIAGHAIEARLYAEDPANDFLPATGRLARFGVPGGVRVDSGVEDGSEIGVNYDPMIAKVIAHAPTRAEAAAKLARALELAEVHGPRTNRDFLVRVLRHPEFLEGRTDTHFLERHDLTAPLVEGEGARLHAAAAALAGQAARRAAAPVLASVPSGFRNVPSQPQRTEFDGLTVDYALRRDGIEIAVGGEPLEDVRIGTCTPDAVDLETGGVTRRYRVHVDGETSWVNSTFGQTELRELPRFPSAGGERAAGSLVSPMPGAVLRVEAEPGTRVEKGAPLLVIEAMKMEHEIVAPAAGILSEVLVAAGDQVQAGALLAVIDEAGDGTG